MVDVACRSDPATPAGHEALGPQVLAIVRSVADELRPQTRLSPALGLDHSLGRDFGLASLARVELINGDQVDRKGDITIVR